MKGLVRMANRALESPRGPLLIAACRSAGALAARVADRYRERTKGHDVREQVSFVSDIDFQFSDGETCVRVSESEIGGHDVFLLQCLYDPRSARSIDANYIAFLAAARTFREHGANYVTGILPYLAYSRQDKPTQFEREPTTAKLMADLSIVAGCDRLITWDPHSPQVHGFYAKVPVTVLEKAPFFTHALGRFEGRSDTVIVAPDAGAVKRVNRLCQELNLQSAVAAKVRPRPEQAEITDIIGDFAGKRIALVPDDMISSGGTVDALIDKLVNEKRIEEIYLAVSHNLCSEIAYTRLDKHRQSGHVAGIAVTNSIPQTDAFLEWPDLSVFDVADSIAHAVDCIHHNRAVDQHSA